MLVLAFDTASPFCSAVLAEDGYILAQRQEHIGKGHAEHLLPQIAAVLGEAGRNFRQIDRIGVNIGPGSFTGIRIGVAAARAFALALNIPAVGVSAFAALAEQAWTQAKRDSTADKRNSPDILAVLRAPQDNFYWSLFRHYSAEFPDYADLADCACADLIYEEQTEPEPAPASGTEAELAAFMRENLSAETEAYKERPILLIGSGAEAAQTLLTRGGGKFGGRPVLLIGAQPTAAVVYYALAAERASGTQAAIAPKPLYMRAADAKPQTASPLAQAKTQFRAAAAADKKANAASVSAAAGGNSRRGAGENS